ncbi:uncharacterized protein TNCV_4130171 [Trichonephila clavipes]|nr:uncharacterized protein TNCV_4130171 [Trichonephila clavipes]
MGRLEIIARHVLEHLPYSRDRTPCNIYVFPKVKNALNGTHFQSVEGHNRIVMKHRRLVDNFLLGRVIGHLKCRLTLNEVSEELGFAQSIVSSLGQQIQDDKNCEVIYSQFGLAIHQNDHQARRRFVEWAQNEIAVVLDFHKRILFSDEAHFWLNGYANKQNCRVWSEANPQVYVETPLHPAKLTVWGALWAGGIIGPYFFKNDEGHNVAVNSDRYRAMITNFFIPELNNHDVQELWF